MSKKRFRVSDASVGIDLEPQKRKEGIDKFFKPKTGVINIKIHLIDPNPIQPRKHFDQKSLKELASSIKKQKVLQPLLVRKKQDRFQVIAGERRLRAAKLAGFNEVPAIIKEIPDKDVLELSLVENLQREDLTPLEEGEIFQQIMDRFGYTQEELGNRIGKSRHYIQQRIRLLSLSPSVKKKIATRVASLAQVRNLVGLAPETQEKVLNFIVKNEPTSREVETFIKKLTQPRKKRQRKTRFETIINRLEETENKAKTINLKEINDQQKEQLKQTINSLIAFLLSMKENL